MSWWHAATARLRLLVARRSADTRVDEEIHFHIAMETERLVRESGLSEDEARRQALVAFGGVEKHKETMRDGRGLAWLSGTALDFKLGARMLAKYPGLTLVGVVGMAVAVAVGAVAFSGVSTIVDGALPLDEGDRVVAIQNIDLRTHDEGRRTHLHDLAIWRRSLRAVQDIGAYRTVDRNFITRDQRSESVRIAEMSTSGFRIARVAALLGRYFNADDERPGAPPVVVIGYDVWLNRFAGSSDIIGQTVKLGTVMHTVIGVMPEGFAFPVNNRVWTPLRLNASDFEPGEAPAIDVFARLALDATLGAAQRQAATIAGQLAADDPKGHEHIRTRVLSYPRSFLDSPDLAWAFHIVEFVVSLLLVVIGTNVAILVYARTASRAGEIAVRTALGASRARIVAQLFAEAMVLSTVAAAVGTAAAWLALRQIDAVIARMGGEQVPFWMRFSITPGVIAYVAGLAVLAAVIVGILPAFKATRSRVTSSLQQLGVGGSGMRLGRTWTFLIVTQVAVSVAALPFAFQGVSKWIRLGLVRPLFATEEFLTAPLFLDDAELPAQRPEVPRSVLGKIATIGAPRTRVEDRERSYAARFAAFRTELAARLGGEPHVARVVYSSAAPGTEPSLRIEVDSGAQSDSYIVGYNRIEPDFFEAFDVPLLLGRRFDAGDLTGTTRAVIVNRSFVERVLGGGNPIGRRVRSRGAEWEEIVGVVPDFPNPTDTSALEPKLFRPLLPTDAGPVTLALRAKGATPVSLAMRLREVTVTLNPMLRLGRVADLAETLREGKESERLVLLGVALVMLSVLLLSIAGIYALMSFTVTRRRREIGIRAALGAGQRRVILAVLSKAAGQVGIGIGVGILVVGMMLAGPNGGAITTRQLLSLLAVAAAMTVIGLLAAIGPARRALRIQPIEALKAE
jgi:hypothetical protein